MKFKKGNKIRYGQDFNQYVGIPHDVEWGFVNQVADNILQLKAPGYGGKPYGNGSIFIYLLTLEDKNNE